MKKAPKTSKNQARVSIDTAYENIANAIILQAVDDYEKVFGFNDRLSLKEAREIESFFRSQYFSVLTGLDGEELLNAVRERINGRRVNSNDG